MIRALFIASLLTLGLLPATSLYAYDTVAMGSNAVVLAYQRFGDRRHHMYISEDSFRSQLEYLDNNGFRVWPLERIVRRLRTGQPIPDKTVSITIDGTHPSVYEIAYPLLKAKGWPFTVFVVPDKVDQIPLGNMSWEQMREMKRDVASFANNSINHIHLVRPLRGYPPRAWVHYVRDNVLNAQARLQEELGPDTNQLRLFAYPYGEYSTALANILAEIGYTAFGHHPGAISQHSDPRGLPRFLLHRHNSNPKSFANKVNSVALAVTDLTPWNPNVSETQSPVLSVELDPDRPTPKYLSCYTREGKRLEVKWNNKAHTKFTLSYNGRLSRGYSYYQCTSRYLDSQRLYWFSQPWVISKRKQAEKTPEEQEAEEQAKDLKEVSGDDSPNETPPAVEPEANGTTPN
ncbi:MAG: polysaccharide deacetylase family protein [Gammaproteobacteria bacterium]|nr:polysaccharide deacetylase family protein [Gammaproteobacteria bacterium]